MVHPLGLVNSRRDPLLEDQGAYKSQKSQALWGNKGLTSRKSRKPFGEPRGHTSRTSRKPFGGPKGLQVAKSKAILGTKELTCRRLFGGPRGLQVAKVTKVASRFGEKGAYKSQKSQALWGERWGPYKSQKS